MSDLAALLAVVVSAPALAQRGATPVTSAPPARCQFEIQKGATTNLNSIKLPSGRYNYFFGGGIVALCRKQNITLKSDSLEVYGDEGRSYFIGHVDYDEPRLRLKSEFLTYFQREERILAYLNVDARLPSGSTLKGSSLEYFRAIPRVRVQQRAIAVARPTLTVIDRNGQGNAAAPVTVTGNTIWLEGDSVVASQGQVVVVEPRLTATGDSLYLDNGKELVRLMRNPKMTATTGRPITLKGETIDLLSRKRRLVRVLAKSGAEAVSEDLDLKSDTIDLRVTDDLLQRAIAWGAGRARATSPAQSIISDSIDILMPVQRMREMHAIRGASAEGTPDTSKFHTTEKDRLTGDTILARFDSIPAKDTVSKPRIRQLVATGIPGHPATSLQHLPPPDTTLRIPAINYVYGRSITVTFDSAKVSRVVVTDSAGGVYREPRPDSTAKARPRSPAPGGSVPPRTPPPAATAPPKAAARPEQPAGRP